MSAPSCAAPACDDAESVDSCRLDAAMRCVSNAADDRGTRAVLVARVTADRIVPAVHRLHTGEIILYYTQTNEQA